MEVFATLKQPRFFIGESLVHVLGRKYRATLRVKNLRRTQLI